MSRSVRLLLSLVLFTPAARGEEPRFIVLARSTPLRLSPDAKARSVRLATSETREEFLHYRLVAARPDGWLEIESDPDGSDPISARESDATTHCYPSPWDSLALRFFVRADERVAVTTRTVNLEYPDGTSAVLSAGVAVPRAAAAPTRTVSADGFRFAAAIADDATGSDYAGDAGLPEGRAAASVLPVAARMTLHGAPFRLTHDLGYRRATAVRRGARTLATIVAGCGTYRVLLAAGSRLQQADNSPALLAALSDSGDAVDPGSDALWPDGTLAGRVVHTLTLTSAPEAHGDRRCYAVDPEWSFHPPATAPDRIKLCFAASAIKPRRSLGDLLHGAPTRDIGSPFGSGPVEVGGVRSEPAKEKP